MIIEANLELIKDAPASEDVESYTKALGKPYRCNKFIGTKNTHTLWPSIKTGIIGIR